MMSKIYHSVPNNEQDAFANYFSEDFSLTAAEHLCEPVISLLIDTEMNEETHSFIPDAVRQFL